MQEEIQYRVLSKSVLVGEIAAEAKALRDVCFSTHSRSVVDRARNNDQFWNVSYEGSAIALVQGSIVGFLGTVRRDVRFHNQIINLGGFSGVCTSPPRRGSGIGTMLVKLGMEELKKMDCDIAYLCTDVKNPSLVRLYGRVGFVLLGKPHSYIGKSGKLYLDEDGMVAPVCSHDIFDQVMRDKETFHIGDGNW